MPINEPIIFDESQAIAALERIIEGLKKGDAQAKKTFKSMAKEAIGADKATDGLTGSLDNVVKKSEELTKRTDTLKSSLKGAADETTVFGVNLGGVIRQMNDKIGVLKGVVSGLRGTEKGLKAVKVALASTGVGLLIVALGTLVTYFTRTQKGIDAANRAFAAMRSVIDNVIDRVAKVGGGLLKIIQGDIRGGINEITGSFKGLGEEIRADAAAAFELEKRSQKLRDAMRDLNVEQERTNALIEEHRFKAKDLALTEAERANNLKEAQRLESQLESQRLALAEENLNIIKERNSLSESFTEDLDAQAEAEAELSRIQAESSRRRKESFAEEQALRKQIADQRKKEREEAAAIARAEAEEVERLREAYEDMISDIDERIANAELEKLTGEDRLRAERDLALSEINILEEKAKAAALAAGVAFEAEKKFTALRLQVQENFQRQIDSGRGDSSTIELLPTREIEAQGEKVALTFSKTLETKIKETIRGKNPFEVLKDRLAESLSVDRDVLDDALSQVEELFGKILAGVEANLDRQLEANEELISSIRDQTESVQSELERQTELKEQGFANDVSLNKMRLAELQKEEKKALEEQRKLKQQKAALETVEQVSSLITASANIFQAFSAIPIVGVPLAIAAIGLMFGTFIATKARASQASRAFKGGPLANYLAGERDGGFVNPGGPSDIPGRGNGIPVGDTGLVLGSDEFVVSEGPAKEHADHLKRLNSGKYRGMKIDTIMRSLPNHKAATARFRSRQVTIDAQDRQDKFTAIRDGMVMAIKEQTGDIISYFANKKNISTIDESTYMEYTDTVRKIVKKVG